jgi:hypothetical protein
MKYFIQTFMLFTALFCSDLQAQYYPGQIYPQQFQVARFCAREVINMHGYCMQTCQDAIWQESCSTVVRSVYSCGPYGCGYALVPQNVCGWVYHWGAPYTFPVHPSRCGAPLPPVFF